MNGLFLPKVSKPHYNPVHFHHRRSPPVSFCGTVLGIILISGTVRMRSGELSAQHCDELISNDENRRPWAHRRAQIQH